MRPPRSGQDSGQLPPDRGARCRHGATGLGRWAVGHVLAGPTAHRPQLGHSCRYQGVTPERLRPTTPARTSLIDTSFTVDTVSPRKAMPITAVPAAPITVHTA